MALLKYEQLKSDGIVGPKASAALRKAHRPRPPHAGDERRVDVILSRQLAFLISGAGRVRRTLSGVAVFNDEHPRLRVRDEGRSAATSGSSVPIATVRVGTSTSKEDGMERYGFAHGH